ncbi:insulin-like 3 [Crocuta crocuta]
MDPRPLPCPLVLLGISLALALGSAPAQGAPEKLCGYHFVRALVRECGGPRWSSEDGRRVAGGDRELLQWLDGRHLQGLVADEDPKLPQAPRHHRHRRAAATNPAHYCCLSGCTREHLLTLCPH